MQECERPDFHTPLKETHPVRTPLIVGMSLICASNVMAQVYDIPGAAPSIDRWFYPFAGNGTEVQAPTFAALLQAGFDDRDSQMLLAFATSPTVPTNRGARRYVVQSARVRLWVSADLRFAYDPSWDSVATSFAEADPTREPDADVGKPVEIFAAGWRGGWHPMNFAENGPFANGPSFPPQEGIRNAYAANLDASGNATDVSRHVRQRFEATPLSVGTCALPPGTMVPAGTEFVFELDVSSPGAAAYLGQALNQGRVAFIVSTLHPAAGGPGGGQGDPNYPAFYTKENPLSPVLGFTPRLEMSVLAYPSPDFNGSGGTPDDADVDAFFSAWSVGDESADFNLSGGTPDDADVDAFFTAWALGE